MTSGTKSPSKSATLKKGVWTDAALKVLKERYLHRRADGTQETPEEMVWRVASAIAGAEQEYGAPEDEIQAVARKFYDLLIERKFVPNSPTLMNAGLGTNLQYSACYVLPVEDSIEGIFESIQHAAIVHQSGGGTGFAFSRLRPNGNRVQTSGGVASGPVSFMKVFDAATEAIKQGGCLSAGTWVRTGHGLRQMGSLLRTPPPQDAPLYTDILGRDGYQMAYLSQNNGLAPTYRIHTHLGLSLEATYNHLVRVVSEQGTIVWRAAEAIQPGDWLVVRLGDHTGDDAPLPPCPAQYHTATPLRLPASMNPELAELIGYFMADGCLSTLNDKPARFVFAVSHTTPDVESWLIETLETLGIRPGREQKANDASSLIIARSVTLAEWWQAAGFDKEDSLHATVPGLIRSASTESVRAFLRGLFEGDGDVSSNGQARLSSTSAALIEQVQQLLLGLGILCRISKVERTGNSYGEHARYELRISHRPSLLVFAEAIGFRSQLKRQRLAERIAKATGERNDPIPHAGAVLARYYRLPGRGSGAGRGPRSEHPELNREIARYLRGERHPSRQRLISLAGQISKLGPMVSDEMLRDDLAYARVTSTERSRAHTMDIEVSTSEFVANGFLVHNRRRGANMGILRVDHPDIEEFITCKLNGGITNFNISVAATDAFMQALAKGEDYDLIAQPGWPAPDGGRYRGGETVGKKSAREVFDKIVKAAWQTGDPGLVFIDRINNSPANPTPELGLIEATNPCGEQPLMSNEACNLGSIDLAKFVRPSQSNGSDPIDWHGLEEAIRLAVRFLDDVITVNPYPLPQIDEAVKANRRIGLGVMGWADMLFELGIPYDSQEALSLAERVMGFIKEIGHDEDARLAEARGPFPNWPRSIYKDDRPRRNSTVTTIAPTGSISIIAGTSSGIEPMFALAFRHIVKQPGGGERVLTFVNPLFERAAKERGFWSEELMAEIARRGTCHGVEGVPPDIQRVFVSAHEVPPEWHIRTQAAFQKYTDNGVSKTINLPNQASLDDVARAYRLAYETGCLGITVFRDGSKSEQVLNLGVKESASQQAGETSNLQSLISKVSKPRPAVLEGTTYRKNTPLGAAYITVNSNGEGKRQPFEVFINIGKAGSDTTALAEALGRLISLVLRLPSPLSAFERVQDIVGQLRGIGSGRATGFGPQRVMSLPDALAQVLAEHVGLSGTEPLPGLPELDHEPHQLPLFPGADLCPECGQATFVMQEGCKKCHACGYSEC